MSSEMELEKPELTLYNTMTQQKEFLKPINPGKIGMYVCGITANGFSHIGHARAAVSFDVLYRYLKHLGYEVTYVRNFTDVDDKVIDKANKCGENPLDFSSRFCEEYLVDMNALQCLLPTHQPRVSDHMEHIIRMIETICEDGGKAEQTAEAKEIVKEVKSEFETKMSDDLNTAHALAGAFQDAMKFINVSITKLKKMQKKQRMSLVVSLVEVEKAVREVLDVLGLLTSLSYAEFLKEMKQKALARAQLREEEVLRRIETRKVARMNKNFEQSDDIRKTLALRGISLMDIPGKDTVWRPCLPCSSQPKSAATKATPP